MESDEPPPEGPEVRRIVDQLNRVASGKRLQEFVVLGGRYAKRLPDDLLSLKSACEFDPVIQEVRCKGKFIFFKLDRGSIWNTLGMTGTWSLHRDSVLPKHPVAGLLLAGKQGETEFLIFSDQRHFGTLKFVEDDQILLKKLKSLGPDVLADELTPEIFTKIIRARGKCEITEVLMNQSCLSGVGNYMKAEALYRSRISPLRLCSGLCDDEIWRLLTEILAVARESYSDGGTTIRNYKDLGGKPGGYAKKLLVYGKSQDPHGNVVRKSTTRDGRTTHWVPAVQF